MRPRTPDAPTRYVRLPKSGEAPTSAASHRGSHSPPLLLLLRSHLTARRWILSATPSRCLALRSGRSSSHACAPRTGNACAGCAAPVRPEANSLPPALASTGSVRICGLNERRWSSGRPAPRARLPPPAASPRKRPQEREVALLAVSGLTIREIAARPYVSPRGARHAARRQPDDSRLTEGCASQPQPRPRALLKTVAKPSIARKAQPR